MGRHECSSGHRWKTRFQPSPRELFCKECGEGAVPALKAASNRRNALQAASESRRVDSRHARLLSGVNQRTANELVARLNRIRDALSALTDQHKDNEEEAS